MNKNKLLAIMKLNGDIQEDLAAAIGVTRSSLYKKLYGKNSSFTQPEILAIKKRYSLSSEQIDEIFFETSVSK